MAREGRDVISVCCIKNDAGNVGSDEVDCPEVMGPCCLISEEEVAAAIKGLTIGKATGPTGVVSEMMKAAGGFGSC